jgi:phosphoglycerate kinase
MPVDVAVDHGGMRDELAVAELPASGQIVDIGEETIAMYEDRLATAGTIFVNGPAGVYEREFGEEGTKRLWKAVAASPATTVIGGGDTVSSAQKYIDLDEVDFVSTGGGALIRFLSGQELPLLKSMDAPATI